MKIRATDFIRFSIPSICLFAVFILPTCAMAQEKGMSREEVINALERGVVALRAIDRPDQAEHLLKTLREYAGTRSKSREEPTREKRKMTEREIGVQHVKHMRYGLEGLLDAGRADAADLLERAIRARELRLEGAQGPEAKEIMESAPGRGQVVELMLFSAKLLDESGKKEKAYVVRELGERFRATWERNRERSEKRESETKQTRKRESDRQSSLPVEKLLVQSEQLQMQCAELQERFQQLERQTGALMRLSNQLHESIARAAQRDR